jgi:hypothetical protein
MLDMPMLNSQKSEETELFAQGLDQYIKTRNLTTLKRLPEEYPQGEWRTRSEGIVDIAERQIAQQKYLEMQNEELIKIQKQQEMKNQEFAKIQKQKEQQQARLEKKDEELAQTQQEKEVLFQDNKILEVTLERLKQVLIDMELRTE